MKSYLGVEIVQAEPQLTDQGGVYQYLLVMPDRDEVLIPRKDFEKKFILLDDPTRITPSVVDSFLGAVEAKQIDDKTALVKVKTISGFVQYETASCVDPENFDINVGGDIGFNRIKNTLWECLGFILQWGKSGLSKGEWTKNYGR